MNTKLTLRMDEGLVARAKKEARRRGKSVSQMTAEFIESLNRECALSHPLPPITNSLLGILKGQELSEKDYRRHLREKHL